MFRPVVLRFFALAALVLSAASLLASLALLGRHAEVAWSVLPKALLVWAACLGYRLTYYQLRAEEYETVGIRIYLLIPAFVGFLFWGNLAGLGLVVGLLATLWGLKKNYDEWPQDDAGEEPEDDLL